MARIVVPGEIVSDKPARMAYTYTDGTNTYATVVSMFTAENKLIPLEGPYEPLAEDVVVGFVKEVRFAGYDVEINSAYHGFLSSRDSRQSFRLGEIMLARIANVDEVRTIDLSDGKPLGEGMLQPISPVKVPRLIGKKNSMINMIANATGCRMIVGRNGFVFISSEGDSNLAKDAISMIEAQAHTSGLTDRVAEFLSQKCGRAISPPPPMENNMAPDMGQTEGGVNDPRMADQGEGNYPPREGGYGGERRDSRPREGGYGRRDGGRPPMRRFRNSSRY